VGQFASFVVVGSLGFLVDASILSALVMAADWSPYAARIVSFAAAVTVTWYCNRTWVFARTANPHREYGAYFAVQAIGALMNLGAYMAIVALFPASGRMPVIPLAAGSALALGFNYAAMHLFVFKR
jgi:putative flippase GtrA